MDDAPTRRDTVKNGSALGAVASLGGCATVTVCADALGDLDATGVAARIRAREITAQEALEASIARAERVNPELNFIASPAHDYGRARAGHALTGPFAGVPTLIKDLMAVTGLPLRFGSRAFDGNIAREQSPYMDALLGAGLVPFGKSATPEFGLTATTESLLSGATRNPWNPSLSSGGSSGGAAAAVASGAVPVAQASDGGGSIRIPSSCCGLFGLKVSRDRNLVSGIPEPGISLSVAGCVSRSVRDSAAWLSATEQKTGGALAPVGMVTGPNTKRLRIVVALKDTLGRDPHPDVKAAIEGVAELCTALGHDVRAGDFSSIDGDAFAQAFTLIWASGAAMVVAQAQHLRPGVALDAVLEPLTIGLAEMFRAAPQGAYEHALAYMRDFEIQYAQTFANADVLLTPVLAKTPPPIGEIAPAAGMEGFARVRDYAVYTPLQNAAGTPAMSVPLSMSPQGMPIGAHFAAAKGQERMLLELAYELEHAAPWRQRRPRVWAG